MKHKPQIIGALQAIGLVLYIAGFASLIQLVDHNGPIEQTSPALGISFVLLLFVTSALITGSIALGYPITLFFIKDKKREALEIVGWTIAWLVLSVFTLVVSLAVRGLWG